MIAAPGPLERLATGCGLLDRIIGGGLPAQSLTIVAGEPGTGKTLLALQMLSMAGLYLTTLSEPSLRLLALHAWCCVRRGQTRRSRS